LEEFENNPESLEPLSFKKKESLFSVFIDKFFRYSKPSIKRMTGHEEEEMENVKLIMIKHLFDKMIKRGDSRPITIRESLKQQSETF